MSPTPGPWQVVDTEDASGLQDDVPILAIEALADMTRAAAPCTLQLESRVLPCNGKIAAAIAINVANVNRLSGG